MPSRRSHTKTRLGCRQCKARKVRCDEIGPVCKACTRRGEKCSLDPSTTEPLPASASLSNTITDLSPAACLDLRLMHHFTYTVALTLTASRPAQVTWQAVVPLRAETQPMLMHALLALSGLHSSQHSSESTAYAERALSHKQATLSLFRQDLADLQAQRSSQHAESLALVSTIVAILSFAEWHFGKRSPGLEDIVDIFTLAQGSNSLWTTGYSVGFDSDIAAIYHNTAGHDVREQPAPRSPADEDLMHRLKVAKDSAVDTLHHDALDVLESVMRREAEGTTEIQIIGHWPACISVDFLNSLRARDPVSLSILEIWGLFIRRCEHLWWIGDWSQKIERALKASS